MIRILIIVYICCSITMGTMGQYQPEPTHPFGLQGFKEVVFSVQDLDAAVELYQKTGAWEVLSRSERAGKALARFWGLADDQRIEEVVLRNPGDEEGYLRLVKFHDVEQQQIRSGAQSWDTGGIFDVNVRILDMDDKFRALQSEGWHSYSDPIAFKFGDFHVEEVLMQGHDGVVLAMIRRHAPPLEGYPNLKGFSHIFNGTQVVKDITIAYDFYVNKLGFKVYLQHEGASTKPGPNVLGLPHNLATQIVRKVYIVHPEAVNFGSVELLQFEGVSGKDCSQLAIPPNLGILMHRFPVKDLEGFVKALRAKGVEIRQPPAFLEIQPYGRVRVMALQSPDGAWLEFMEL